MDSRRDVATWTWNYLLYRRHNDVGVTSCIDSYQKMNSEFKRISMVHEGTSHTGLGFQSNWDKKLIKNFCSYKPDVVFTAKTMTARLQDTHNIFTTKKLRAQLEHSAYVLFADTFPSKTVRTLVVQHCCLTITSSRWDAVPETARQSSNNLLPK